MCRRYANINKGPSPEKGITKREYERGGGHYTGVSKILRGEG